MRSPTNETTARLDVMTARLSREIEGEVLFDDFSRGRDAADASIYQIQPAGVVVPKRFSDFEAWGAKAWLNIPLD